MEAISTKESEVYSVTSTPIERAEPHTDKVGTITRAQLEEIAEIKMEHLNAVDLDGAVKVIAGSARSMGVEVAE